MQYLPLVGRILYALIFILSGVGHFAALEATSQYAGSAGVPMPEVAAIVSGIMILLGGLSIALGYKVKWGAILLVAFLIPAAFMMHNFWSIDDPMMAQTQMAMFMKNIALAGAALFMMYFGSGPFSLEKDEGLEK